MFPLEIKVGLLLRYVSMCQNMGTRQNVVSFWFPFNPAFKRDPLNARPLVPRAPSPVLFASQAREKMELERVLPEDKLRENWARDAKFRAVNVLGRLPHPLT